MIKISNAEIEVMKVIWSKKEVTSLEIIRELERHNWNNNTIRTLIGRLISKKAVGVGKKEGKTYTYVPLIKESEYKAKRIKDLIQQLFHDSFNEMLISYICNNELNIKELNELIEIINKRGEYREQ